MIYYIHERWSDEFKNLCVWCEVCQIQKEAFKPWHRSKERGLYVAKGEVFNADAVGAYNIMRKYFAISGIEKEMSVSGLANTRILKVAV